jgi:putative transposase
MLRRHSSNNFPGSIHFITLVTQIRDNWFTSEKICLDILNSFGFCLMKTGVECYGYVLMPDHLHALLLEVEASESVSKLVQDFKKFTSRKLKPSNYPDDNLWRTRFDDVPVPGANAVRTKLIYIHNNPVRAGIADTAETYRWSSAGIYANDEEAGVQIKRVNPI